MHNPSRKNRLAGLAVIQLAVACAGPVKEEPAPPAAAQEAESTKSVAPAGLSVENARASLMPGMGAVYLEVVNPGADADRLLKVECAAAQAAETHETVDEDGMMRMVPHPEGFAVPAGGKLELAPGGKHVMLIEPQVPEGATSLALTLHFEHAGAIEVEAVALDAGHVHEMEH